MVQINDQQTHEITIVGGGIIGLAIGLKLSLEGCSVTIIDKDTPASGCSAGNAGYLSQNGIFPLASWDTIRTLPKLLLDPTGPLIIRPSYFLQLIPWGLKLLRNSSPEKTQSIIKALADLTRDAIDDYAELLAASQSTNLIKYQGGLHLYNSEQALDSASRRLETVNNYDIEAYKISAKEVYDREPALVEGLAGAVFFPNNAHCINPAELGAAFANAILSKGGQIIQRQVHKVSPETTGLWKVETSDTPIISKQVIIAAGRWSDSLLKPLGYKVPIESERGYHLMLPNPGFDLSHPLVLVEKSFAITPMKNGIRLAGTVEFAKPGTEMDEYRSDMLYAQAAPFLPGLKNEGATRWMGERPSLPDSLPAIGSSQKLPGLHYAFGHHHCGLTLAASTAGLMTDLVMKRQPKIDSKPFSLRRFGGPE